MLDRKVAPPVQPLARVTLPAADVFSLLNGARLHVLRNDAQPVVRLQVVFKAGKWYEPAPGISLLTARMLLEGTRTRTARQIADEIAFYGASLECEQGFDRATLTLYCLTRHLPKLLPLVLDVLTEATFPDPELEQLKTRTIQNVRVERQKSSYLAAEQFSHNLFGPTYPYGVKFNENLFRLVTATQLRTFHQQRYQLSRSEIFLCGDVADADQKLIGELLGTVVLSSEVKPTLPAVVLAASTLAQDYVLLKGSLQSSLRIGKLWPALSHSQTHELQVLVKVLGGYFGSRLMRNIREDKGLTYGIYASVNPREHASSFVIGSDVNTTNTEAAIKEIHFELSRLQTERIPDDELQTVKNYMAGKFANELSTVFEQCDKYMNLVFHDLPTAYYSEFVERIQDVQSSSLLTLAQEYLSINSMIEVVSGPRE
ncbi:M16 family metallopeptidase [Hymenobacter sublimis]|uniref:Insulinase family protein n=1 Tax=Hymenobacter sublimis TaxID=2933777 RepID=A0ABY4JIM8_9BACT|nr:pitrilysin family protein [Hymenobacter sublimis]UPL51164.1 insulinase family protein [Hymenobacter sublimis]